MNPLSFTHKAIQFGLINKFLPLLKNVSLELYNKNIFLRFIYHGKLLKIHFFFQTYKCFKFTATKCPTTPR